MADSKFSTTAHGTAPVHSTPRAIDERHNTQAESNVEPANNNQHDDGGKSSDEKDLEAAGPAAYGGTHQDPNFPDGGWRAWLVVFGAMCSNFSTFGFVTSWGTFQAHYQRTLLQDSSPSDIAWIGSIQYAIIFLPAFLVGRLFDLGYFRSVFVTSSALLVIATFLVAECKEYWQLLLCQGIVTGLACSGIFGPTKIVVAHWFKLRRGFAMGLLAAGSSIGGTVIPIASKNLIPAVGFKWTMRIIGIMLFVALGCANLTMKRRLPPTRAPGGMFNFRAFKYAPFTTFCLSAFFNFLGLFTVLTYVSVSALQLGFSESLAFYMVAIANASSFFGRLTSGSLADRFGSATVMVPFTAAAGILTYAWPFARTQSSLIAVVILYGFSSGAYLALLSNPIMELGATEDLGRRTGMYMSIFALGTLTGPPISGAISATPGGFNSVGYYAGSMIMIGVTLICLTRHLVLRKMFGKF